jgi:hypothetical protein
MLCVCVWLLVLYTVRRWRSSESSACPVASSHSGAIDVILRTWNFPLASTQKITVRAHICSGIGCKCGFLPHHVNARNLALVKAIKLLMWRVCIKPSQTRWTSMLPGCSQLISKLYESNPPYSRRNVRFPEEVRELRNEFPYQTTFRPY